MDVKALIIAGGHPVDATAERIAGAPIALLDVLGEPVVQRVIERVSRLGVSSIAVISETDDSLIPDLRNHLRPDVKFTHHSREEIWRAAEQQFNDFAQSGAELVLIARIGPYVEADFEEFVQFHLDRGARVSSMTGADGKPLDCFLVSASRRNDAAHLLRSELRHSRSECQQYKFTGYANRLQNAGDLRSLAMAAFACECSIRPTGNEIKPGVWAADSAKIHHRARLLAPAFIGRHAKVRASAVVTRGSVIEHHATVDCGTVVENSSILPYSYVGAGLDVTHSIVGFRQIANLVRSTTVEIHDDRLVSMTAISAPMRTLNSAMELVSFLPKAFFHKKQPSVCATGTLPQAVATTSPVLTAVPDSDAGQPVTSTLTNLLTARRYGNE